jgi:hypothetical protein
MFVMYVFIGIVKGVLDYQRKTKSERAMKNIQQWAAEELSKTK